MVKRCEENAMTILEIVYFILMLLFGILGILMYILRFLRVTIAQKIPENPLPIQASDLGIMGVLVAIFFGIILLVTQHGDILIALEGIKAILVERLPLP